MLRKEHNSVAVLCTFPSLPTLAMFVEAAAQASAAFESEQAKEAKIGFLVAAKEVRLLKEINKKVYVLQVEIKAEINTIKQFYFEAFDEEDSVKYVSGYFTLIIQE